ncbi:MAG: hypothetical protein KAJ29_02430 [Alphaproteobacteria bacterium]|nr:hypothetical protein [Alphaproteobacteria bacterium]
MQHIGQITVATLKKWLPPEQYYAKHLQGAFGKHTGNDWHMWDGLCPFHDDTHIGSFFINRKQGAFHCFSCGAKGGDIFAFHMMRTGCSFKEAVEQLGGLLCESA